MKKLSAPAHEDEVRQFLDACKKVEDEPAETLRKLARAFAIHVEKHGQIVHPIRFTQPKQGKR